ncbi:hypothetical protein JI435_424320 [Parastagonospora nodorum SN15]|uniref:Uncharacterized protein n=1 Tax=Phaeosphaeria nodorum (strain SN15 / ATCC MYA-4574 / FGSC 10173) TaxID=321614 RepID=A0A7U2ICN2_PHANO|nr:hypothetical protein JI435_424320 [Parastagonospora nodorum SN15]
MSGDDLDSILGLLLLFGTHGHIVVDAGALMIADESGSKLM